MEAKWPQVDKYVLKARIAPALLVFLPVSIATVVWFPDTQVWWGILSGLLIGSGGGLLLAQVGRDAGKRKEKTLFSMWGGKPSTRFLRHRDAPNRVHLARIHKKLEAIISGLQMPSVDVERQNPELADQVYDTAVRVLRERTRDKKIFWLLFDENCNYGFRRNLWGLKPLGVALTLISLLAVGVSLAKSYSAGTNPASLAYLGGAVNLLILLGWWKWITPEWVRIAGEAYAEQLLAACERL